MVWTSSVQPPTSFGTTGRLLTRKLWLSCICNSGVAAAAEVDAIGSLFPSITLFFKGGEEKKQLAKRRSNCSSEESGQDVQRKLHWLLIPQLRLRVAPRDLNGVKPPDMDVFLANSRVCCLCGDQTSNRLLFIYLSQLDYNISFS